MGAARDGKGWAPGERFCYSNDGYKALGLVLGAITGEPYDVTIRARILQPLGMKRTDPTITQHTRTHLAVPYVSFYDDRPAHRSHPIVPAPWFETDTADGCLASTAEDMATFVRMLLNRGQGPAGRVLSEDSFDAMTRRIIPVDGAGGWYGYGLFIAEDEGHTVVGHGGAMVGFYADITADLDAGVGAVVLVNGPGRPGTIATFGRRLLRAAREQRALPAVPPPKNPESVPKAADYVGAYTSPRGSFRLRADGDRLTMEWRGTNVVLEERREDAFYVPHPDFELFLLCFERDAEQVTQASHGPDWYVNEHYAGPSVFDAPAEWRSYVGHYRSFSPWLSNFRVLLRKGELFLSYPQHGHGARLKPAGEATFTFPDDMPGFLRFGPIVNGHAISANLIGGEFYRVNTP